MKEDGFRATSSIFLAFLHKLKRGLTRIYYIRWPILRERERGNFAEGGSTKQQNN